MSVTPKYISEEELRAHNKRDDLWISIHGKVYNVTDWVNHHPGGELPLFYLAGQDVTDAFLAYHPSSAALHLNQFFTGYHLIDYKVSELSLDYRKLTQEFQNLGLFEKKDHGLLVLMVFTFLMFFLSVYGVLFSNSICFHLACGLALGCAWTQCFWIMHDSSHYQAMINPNFNQFVQLLSANCLGGTSSSWWKKEHTAHHIACNSLEYDPDTQYMPFFVFSSKCFTTLKSYFYEKEMYFNSLTRFFVSYQYFTFYAGVALLKERFYVQSLLFLLFEKKVPNRAQQLVGLLVFWTYFSLLIACLPDWFERIAFLVAAFGVTWIQNLQFTLSHVACDVYLGPPSGKDWFEKQAVGSLNINCSSWMDWFHGGLYFQVEHHLFPRIPRCHLRKISPFVEQLCKMHNLPYNRATSLWEAWASTINHVQAVALQARDVVKSAK